MNVSAPPIERLGPEAAGELLTLQRAAYVTEAQAHGDLALPPLTETLDGVRAVLGDPGATVLGVRRGGRLVGAVRVLGRRDAPGVVEVARLVVAPDQQGRGVGSALLLAAERHAPPGTREVRLFTGERSVRNLRLYARHGYRETHRTRAAGYDLVHLAKALTSS
jgi:ribosomal protein S18 acetylase RimI-like enzyme